MAFLSVLQESGRIGRGLDGTELKLLALALMLVDHVGYIFFPHTIWLRAVGRLSMPIFCFCLAEGSVHTHSRVHYLLRLVLAALVSELPFDLAFYGRPTGVTQNVFFTFALALPALWLLEWGIARGGACALAGAGGCVLLCGLSAALKTDYAVIGVLLVCLFGLLRTQGTMTQGIGAGAFLLLARRTAVQRCAALGVLPLLLYNGQRGKGMKILFYAFYPLHLLALWILKRML